MSYANYEKAMELAKEKKHYRADGESTDELVTQVENALGIKLSRQHYDFYKQYGSISFVGSEFLGIDPRTFNDTYDCLNAVKVALDDRKKLRLPHDWIPLYEYGNSEVAYVDYGMLNAEGEPRIIVGHYHPDGFQLLEVVAEDIGDFILEIVGWKLE